MWERATEQRTDLWVLGGGGDTSRPPRRSPKSRLEAPARRRTRSRSPLPLIPHHGVNERRWLFTSAVTQRCEGSVWIQHHVHADGKNGFREQQLSGTSRTAAAAPLLSCCFLLLTNVGKATRIKTSKQNLLSPAARGLQVALNH